MARRERKRAEIDRHEDAGPARLPGKPTSALPGSEEKVKVMCGRANRREQLFHPDDRSTPGSRLLWEQARNGTLIRAGVEDAQKPVAPPGSFAARLIACRAAAGLSQYALAKRAGVDRACLSRLEAGKREPTLGVLAALATALDKTLDELTGFRRKKH